jgi:hypothetical protein
MGSGLMILAIDPAVLCGRTARHNQRSKEWEYVFFEIHQV